LHRLSAANQTLIDTVPVGRAIPNTRLYVLDSNCTMPIGAAGSFVSAVSARPRHINDPEQTSESSLATRSRTVGRRVVQNGDLARWHPTERLSASAA